MRAISVPLLPAEQLTRVPFKSIEDLADSVDVSGVVEIRDKIKTLVLICIEIDGTDWVDEIIPLSEL